MIEILGQTVTVSLPDWFGEQDADYRVVEKYPEGHRWAGTFKEDRFENEHVDAIFEQFAFGDLVIEEVSSIHKYATFGTELPASEVVALVEKFLLGLKSDV